MPKTLLDEWMSLRDCSLAELKERWAIEDRHIQFPVNYGKLTGLTVLHNPAVNPGQAFFSGDAFVLFYVNRVEAFNRSFLIEKLGEPEYTLRSRAGKRYLHHIYGLYGVAFAAEKNTEHVRLLEIFKPPVTLEQYQATFYVQPGKFIR